MRLLERIREIDEQPWQPVSTGALAAASLAALYILYFANSGEGWVFPLDNANLAFHEAGHPLFGLLHEDLAVYGGTLVQLAFPLIASVVFWARREAASAALCVAWIGDNLFNIGRYMADARAMALPLVGGLDPEWAHDWNDIFARWHLLRFDTAIGSLTRLVAWILILAALGWLSRRWWCERQEGSES